MISGANVLPFGLITDVSAGALAAGAGGLQGLFKAAPGPDGKSGFETELGAFAETLAGGEGGSLTGAELVSDALPPAFAAGVQPEAFAPTAILDGSGSEAGQAILAAPGGDTPQAPVKGPAGGGLPQPVAGDDAPLQAPRLASASGGAQVPVEGPASAKGSGQTPGAAAAPGTVLRDGLPVRSDVAGKSGLAPAPQAPLIAAAASPDVAPAVLSGAAVPAPEAGEASEAGRLPGVADPLAAGAVTLKTSEITNPVAGEPLNVKPETQAARRWQSELPSALRAPVMSFGQQAAPSQPMDPLIAAATNDGEAGSAPSSNPLTVQRVPPTVPGSTPEAPVPANAQPVSAKITGVGAGAGSLAGEPAVSDAAARAIAPVLPVRTAQLTPGNAAAQPAAAQISSEATDPVSTGGFEPGPGEQEAAGKAGKPSPGASPGERASEAASAKSAHGAVQKPASGGPDDRTGQGTASAVFLAAQPVSDDQLLSVQPLEAGLAGELGATVRGGDSIGAMRTESLQTPSQAQSGQVATQVAAEIARNLKNGQTRFQMRFDPPELGRVDVNMRVGADGGVHAHLIVERPETLDMFLRDQRGLERALEAAGLNADSDNLQFSLKQEGNRGFASGDGQSDPSADQNRDESGSDADEDDLSGEHIVRMTLSGRPGGLDLKI